MNHTERLFCKCIRLSFHSEEHSLFSEKERQDITKHLSDFLSLAIKHNLTTNLYEALCLLDISLPDGDRSYLRQTVTGNALGCYHMLSFTRRILRILEQEHITYFLLKGVSLLECFPKPELRSFGDVDILVPNADDFAHLKNTLMSQGFQPESSFAEHHLEMCCSENGRTFLIEIHHRVIARQANAKFNHDMEAIFQHTAPVAGSYPLTELSYYTFPVTENALYLLLHMLQHFLGSGFGIKLLCDWTAYLEKHGADIDSVKFPAYLRQLGLEKFCDAMTALCQEYLGLQTEHLSFFSAKQQWSREFLDSLIQDIFEAGTFGKTSSNRMLIMSNGGRFSQYFIELHRQMKKRFQKCCKVVPLWPALWVITAFCFVWNNYFIRHTSTKEIFATARKRQNLVKELTLFQKGDKKDES